MDESEVNDRFERLASNKFNQIISCVIANKSIITPMNTIGILLWPIEVNQKRLKNFVEKGHTNSRPNIIKYINNSIKIVNTVEIAQ